MDVNPRVCLKENPSGKTSRGPVLVPDRYFICFGRFVLQSPVKDVYEQNIGRVVKNSKRLNRFCFLCFGLAKDFRFFLFFKKEMAAEQLLFAA